MSLFWYVELTVGCLELHRRLHFPLYGGLEGFWKHVDVGFQMFLEMDTGVEMSSSRPQTVEKLQDCATVLENRTCIPSQNGDQTGRENLVTMEI